jgi:farnesyl-diphosphate farnesyltransferase
MANDESVYERELGGQLLAAVSRSFYLTLKALPSVLREPISLAYLLARTADTIADTAAVPATVRLECLAQFDALVSGEQGDAAALAELLAREFMPLQQDDSEAVLMRRFREALAWLGSMRGTPLEAIRKVLRVIVSGQRLDLERFPGDVLRSLQTAAELDDYTYRVAGCVGEFWTELCLSELPQAFADGTDADFIKAAGIRFGQGLQLVNILRDLTKDAALGRCYLPQQEWSAAGLTMQAVERDAELLRPSAERWAQRCAEHLRAAVTYVCAVQHGTLRYATALPLVLGWHTLRDLRKASTSERRAGVKVSRLTVTKVLAQVAMNNSAQGIAKLCAALDDRA